MVARWERVRRGLRLVGHYARFNLGAGMEYRASFVAQVLGMALNNSAFIVFWLILYGQLGSISGYRFSDVMFLWALSLFQAFNPTRMIILVAADAGVVLVAWAAFRLGLRAYESGSRMGARI